MEDLDQTQNTKQLGHPPAQTEDQTLTPPPQVAGQDPISPSIEHKKPPKNLIILIAAIILTLLLCALATIVLINLTKSQPTTTDPDPDQNTSQSESTDLAVQSIYDQLYDFVKQTIQTAGYEYTIDSDSDFFPIIIPDGYDFAVRTDKSYGLIVTPGPKSEYLISEDFSLAVENEFTALGFSTYTAVATFDLTFHSKSYIKDTIVCSSSDSGAPFGIACADKNWSDAAQYRPFYEAAPQFDFFDGSINPIDSPYQPYQHVAISGAVVGLLFYRTNPDSEWIYFTATQDAPLCSAFNTTDIKRAFQGETCLTDDYTSSKVTL
jgi:hypothetical protein